MEPLIPTVRVDLKKLLCISVALLAVAPFNSGATPPGDDSGSKSPVPVTTVKTLQPAFAWTPSPESGVSYELIICVAVKGPHGIWIPGKTAYYRAGIKGTKHIVAQPLSPDTVYVWSVRTRSGKGTSKWAAFGDTDPSFGQKSRVGYEAMCAFKTPTHSD